MANFKHKVFLLIAKWIPVAVAAGILINNTLAMLDVKDVILDLFDITVGSSLAFVIMMYACSYVFNFCYWHKIVITYDLYASKGVAGTGLGLGIAGTALWLLSGGLGGGLFGNRMGAAGAVAAGVEKEDKCELINGM